MTRRKYLMSNCPLLVALSLAATAALAGCSSGGSGQAAPTESSTGSVSSSAAAEPSATATPTAPGAAADASLLASVQSALGQWPSVTAVTETEPGWVTVETSIVDPRGDGGSAEALKAIAICQAAVTAGPTHVYVMEADGTHFVLYGHPAYPAGECTEV